MYWRMKTLLLPALAMLSLAATARASIILPEQPAFDLEEVNTDGSGSMSASQSDRDEALPSQSPEVPVEVQRVQLARALPVDGSSGGNTSSAGGSSAGGVFGIASCTASIQQDGNVSWLVIKFSRSIPEPPVSSLLRPPQGGCNISA